MRVLAVFLLAAVSSAALQLSRAVTAVSVAPGWEAAAPASVLNEGAAALRILVEMDTSAAPAGSMPYFCWGPSCYAPGVVLSPDTVTIAPGAREESFKAYVFVEPGTAPAVFPLVFRFRDALSGAVLLEHTVRVEILPVGADVLLLAWAQTELFSREGGEVGGAAALYNAGRSLRRMLVRAEPTGIPPSAFRFCLGDSCYGPGTLSAPDTLVLLPGQFYPRFYCWLRLPEGAGGAVTIRFLDASTANTVAAYSVRVTQAVAIAEPATAAAPCTVLPPVLHGEAVPIRLEPGSVLEITSLLGQSLARYRATTNTAAWLALHTLSPGLYLYRLLRAGAVICVGRVVRLN